MTPSRPTDDACLHCGHLCLQLVFTGDLDGTIGYAHFWCNHCFEGIGISRTAIPENAIVQDMHLPRDERRPKIPNYHLVQ